MEAVYLRLAAFSSRPGFVDVYLLHVQARIETSASMQAWMQVKMPRRWNFQAYQKEQRAHKTSHVSFELTETCRHDRGVGRRGALEEEIPKHGPSS